MKNRRRTISMAGSAGLATLVLATLFLFSNVGVARAAAPCNCTEEFCNECFAREGTCWAFCWGGARCHCSGTNCIVATGPVVGLDGIDPSMRHFDIGGGQPFGGTTFLFNEQIFGYIHANPDSAGLLSPGAKTMTSFFGLDQNADTVLVSQSEVIKVATGRYAVHSDYSSIGSTSQRIVIRIGGSATTLTVPNNTTFHLTDWPSLGHYLQKGNRTILHLTDTTTVIVGGVTYGPTTSVAVAADGENPISTLTRNDTFAQSMPSILYYSALQGTFLPGQSRAGVVIMGSVLLAAAIGTLYAVSRRRRLVSP